MESGIEVTGLEELREDLEKAIKLYPDKAQETLEKNGKQFKTRVVKLTRSTVKKRTGNLIKGYKVLPVEGYGVHMEVKFCATAPHFHLIEHGHRLLANGYNGKYRKEMKKEFVPGYQIVKKTREEYKEILPKEFEKMIDEILEACNL